MALYPLGSMMKRRMLDMDKMAWMYTRKGKVRLHSSKYIVRRKPARIFTLLQKVDSKNVHVCMYVWSQCISCCSSDNSNLNAKSISVYHPEKKKKKKKKKESDILKIYIYDKHIYHIHPNQSLLGLEVV